MTELQVEDLATWSADKLSALGGLSVSARQEVFGGSFGESLTAWHAGPAEHVLGLGFSYAGQAVGMTLFKRPPLSPDWVPADAASIHGLKIATPWQGRGWGHSAFRLAVGRMSAVWPTVNRLVLSVDADNVAATAVYRRFGMADWGARFEGRVGPEYRFEVALTR